MVGTHDSITGEKGKGFLSWLVTPFAKTQTKTLAGQYAAGARFFDIRVKRHRGKWYGAHGLWRSKKDIHEIVNELDGMGGDVYCDITLEGTDRDVEAFMELVEGLVSWNMRRLHIHCACVKLPKWKVVGTYNTSISHMAVHHCFKTLDRSSWHTLIPIPWLWNRIYKIGPVDGAINCYDFL